MLIWEALVLTHLTSREGMFVRPQFDIAWDRNAEEGGSCPDFVAIHPGQPGTIYIIEVSTAWDLKSLSMKFENRNKNWYNPLAKILTIWNYPKPYIFKSIAYVRKDGAHFECRGEDVERRNLEDIAFAWK